MATVNMEDLKPNSHVYKDGLKKDEKKVNKPKLQSVIKKNDVVSTNKSLGKKFAETFIADDVKDVKNYILLDVIIPGIKNTILDGLSMIFFKEPYRGGSKYDRGEHYSYSARYKYKGSSSRRERDRDRDEYVEDKVDYRNIVLKDRNAAMEVVDKLRKRIKDYDSASIADLFDLIDISGKYTDNNWGWTNAEDIGLRRVSNGYLIDVAEADLLDD